MPPIPTASPAGAPRTWARSSTWRIPPTRRTLAAALTLSLLASPAAAQEAADPIGDLLGGTLPAPHQSGSPVPPGEAAPAGSGSAPIAGEAVRTLDGGFVSLAYQPQPRTFVTADELRALHEACVSEPSLTPRCALDLDTATIAYPPSLWQWHAACGVWR